MNVPEEGSRPPRPVKVSVIVSTYCSGERRLSRLIGSLDSQTMDQHDFESVFVDDGSPDDTLARLRDYARDRPHMRVTSIPHSGWPSGPRNVGVSMAGGDYVVFLDHDDELYPGALQDAWTFAEAHALDAVTAKETRSDNPFFSWSSFLADAVPPAQRNSMMLVPMTPHKMYRRQHLLDHDIRFREGGKVLWEDKFFNIDVYASGARVGVLASRPFYHRSMDDGVHISHSYTVDPDEYCQHLASVFQHIDESPMSQADADLLRASRYSYWVLSRMVGPGAPKRDEDYERTLNLAAAFVERWVPRRLDDTLEPVGRARATLLRSGHRDLLRPLAECDRGVRARPVATNVQMVDGLLHVSCNARWTDATAEPLGLRLDSGRLTRVLPDPIAAVLPPALLDFSDALALARGDLSLSGRRTKVGWPAPGHHDNRLVDLGGGRVALETQTTAVFDPRTAALGGPLEHDRWRIACRSSFGGFSSHPFVTYRGPTLVGLADGWVAVARSSSHHHLLLDVSSDVRSVLGATRPDVAGATVRRSGGRHWLEVPVAELSATGSTRLPVRYRLRDLAGGRTTDGGGHLVGEDGAARIELDLRGVERLGRGRHRLILDGPGERWPRGKGWVTEIVVRVGRGGRFARVSVEREPVPRRRHRPVWA